MSTVKKVFDLTIGIPAFNEEGNIKQLLESLLKQTDDNFVINKIIVISDGSTDNTNNLVKNIKSDLITLISGKERLGQNVRQNQIIEMMPKNSDGILFLEADTTPKDKMFLQNLLNRIPESGEFSLITIDHKPETNNSFFGRIIVYGYELKHELFEKAVKYPNLYLSGIGLLSKKFLKEFRWENIHHEDSYCYRMALNSGLPIVRSKNSIVEFRVVQNPRDYYVQSGKFHKAENLESKKSNIYRIKLDPIISLQILSKYIVNNPLLFLFYLVLVISSSIYSIFLPTYTPFWSIYSSTKKL